MAYTTPTASEFKARYPEFDSVPDALINAIIAEQEPQVGLSWIDADRRPALMALVAHMLTLSGYPAADAAGAIGNVTGGAMKRRKVGDVEVEYAGASTGSGSGSGVPAQYAGSRYGILFWSYARRNFAAVAVV